MTLNEKITLKGYALVTVKGFSTFNSKMYNSDEAIKGNIRFVYVQMKEKCEEGFYWSSKVATKGKLVWFNRYHGMWNDPHSCTSLSSKITKGIEKPKNLPKLKMGMILG
jgi:hypothetical protein